MWLKEPIYKQFTLVSFPNSKVSKSINIAFSNELRANSSLAFGCYSVLAFILFANALKSEAVNFNTDLTIKRIEFHQVITFVLRVFSKFLISSKYSNNEKIKIPVCREFNSD